MRRWNGWGDETVTHPLSHATPGVLVALLGPATPPVDTPFAAAVAALPPARLPAHPLVSSEAAVRLRHARGQSFPDLIALRSGRIPAFPDGVAYPLSGADV